MKFNTGVFLFENLSEIQVSMKSDKTDVHFTLRNIHIYYHILLSSSYNHKFFKVADKIKTHILYSIFFFSKISSLHQILWKNTVEPDSIQMVIRGSYRKS